MNERDALAEIIAHSSNEMLARWVLKHLDWSGGNDDANGTFLTAVLDKALRSQSPAPVIGALGETPRTDAIVSVSRPLAGSMEAETSFDKMSFLSRQLERELNALRAAPAIEAGGAEKEIARLNELVYVPGNFQCKKCGFGLVSKTIYMESGTLSANNTPQPCPNGCGPLWRVSERERREEQFDQLLAIRNESLELAASICDEGGVQILADKIRERKTSEAPTTPTVQRSEAGNGGDENGV